MLSALLEVVLPVFAVAGAGFLYQGWRGFPIREATDLIVYLTGACLVFDGLVSAPPFALDAARIPIAVLLLVVGCIALGALARRIVPGLRRFSTGTVAAPAAFMNAGNLGLPLAALAWGEPGLQLMLVFFVSFSVLHWSLGVALVAGRGRMMEALKLPVVYAAALGLVLNQLGVVPPPAVLVPIHLLGQLVIPLMLLSLGARLRTLLQREPGAPALPVAFVVVVPLVRMGGGVLMALLVNAALGNEGLVAKLTVLGGALPPAVMNFALVEKYTGDPVASAAVSGAIAVGTAASVAVLPFVIAWLG